MFTLYRIEKREVAESILDRASVYARNATFGTIPDPEEDRFASVVKDVIPATNEAIDPVRTVQDQLLQRFVPLSGTV